MNEVRPGVRGMSVVWEEKASAWHGSLVICGLESEVANIVSRSRAACSFDRELQATITAQSLTPHCNSQAHHPFPTSVSLWNFSGISFIAQINNGGQIFLLFNYLLPQVSSTLLKLLYGSNALRFPFALLPADI